jgi:hypothetical protein
MTELGPFLLLICVAAVALAGLGAAVGWYNEEGRRIRRGLRHVLKGETHALIIAYGRGRGAGFNFTSSTMAVAWDAGEWCLIYRIDELIGVELIIDGQVAGRAFRGEQRRPVDVLGGAEKQVSLRLVFDDPQHADFILELWGSATKRRPVLDAAEAVEEGNRWLARIDAIFRRKTQAARRAAQAQAPQSEPAGLEPAAQAEAPQAARAEAAPRPAAPPPGPTSATDVRQELPFSDAPWDEDEDAEEKEQASR